MAAGAPSAQISSGPRRWRLLALSAVYAVLIAAGTLLASSLIHDGHGMLGISSAVSVGIVIAVAGGLALALFGAIRSLTEPVGPSAAVGPDLSAESSRRKCDLEFEEWFAFLEEAEKEFYVAGHTMGKWCDPSRRGVFVAQIRRLLAAGGTVTLVMLGPDSPQVPILFDATEKNYSGRIADTSAVLTKLRGSLDPAHRARLRVKQLNDHGAIPYMVVGNETRLVTATYLARTDSDDMPCIELDRGDEAARAIYDDLHKLAGVGVAGTTDPDRPTGRGARLLGRARRR
jgi:hypothetical protein